LDLSLRTFSILIKIKRKQGRKFKESLGVVSIPKESENGNLGRRGERAKPKAFSQFIHVCEKYSVGWACSDWDWEETWQRLGLESIRSY